MDILTIYENSFFDNTINDTMVKLHAKIKEDDNGDQIPSKLLLAKIIDDYKINIDKVKQLLSINTEDLNEYLKQQELQQQASQQQASQQQASQQQKLYEQQQEIEELEIKQQEIEELEIKQQKLLQQQKLYEQQQQKQQEKQKIEQQQFLQAQQQQQQQQDKLNIAKNDIILYFNNTFKDIDTIYIKHKSYKLLLDNIFDCMNEIKNLNLQNKINFPTINDDHVLHIESDKLKLLIINIIDAYI